MTNELAVVEKDTKALIAEANEIACEAEGFKILAPEHFTASGNLLKKIKGKMADFESLDKEARKPFEDKAKTIRTLFKMPIDILKAAEAKIKNAILDWNDKLEADRQAKEAALRKAQEAEAKKLEAKANRAKDPEKKAELQAQAEAVKLAEPIVATQTTKVEGISTVTSWSFEIVDQNLIPKDYLMPDEVKIGKVVRATQGSLQIPGVRIYSYKSIKSTKGY